MNNNVEAIKNRIHLLTVRDMVSNKNIINKLNRRLRKIEAQN